MQIYSMTRQHGAYQLSSKVNLSTCNYMVNTVCEHIPHSIWPTDWWRHQMETFSALLDLCAGNSPVTGEFPAQRPVTRSFDFFFDLRLNKRLSKQSWGWWFDMPLRCHCNGLKPQQNGSHFVVDNLLGFFHDVFLRKKLSEFGIKFYKNMLMCV